MDIETVAVSAGTVERDPFEDIGAADDVEQPRVWVWWDVFEFIDGDQGRVPRGTVVAAADGPDEGRGQGAVR